MNIDKEKLSLIFREYDIRGIAGKEFEPEIVQEYEKWYGPFPGITITPETSRAIGRAYGSHLKTHGEVKKVIVGFEVRPYADILKDEFIQGILDTGIDVDDAGKTITPMIYFLTDFWKYDGGVNITGSHNVYFYNGYKMMQQNSKPLYGDELKNLYKRIINADFDLVSTEKRGVTKSIDNAYETYKNYALSKIKLGKRLKIVIDCGNGTPGLYAEDFFTSLGVDIVEKLFFEPDAKFPNHVPDPESPLNMKFLMEAVKRNNADIGIAFDADGDRVGFVNEKGEFLFADQVILLLAQDIAKRNQGKKVLFDVKCTKLLEDLLPDMGLSPLMHRTGHAPIKDTLRLDHDVVFGGEVSGHYYFAEDYPRADDGFWGAARVLEILSNSEKSFSELLAFIPERVRTPEIKLPCEDSVKFAVVEQVKQELGKNYKLIDIDGARVLFTETSWGLIRASNTSPYLTIRVEGLNEPEVLHIKNVFADILDKIDTIKDKLNREVVASPTGTLGFV